MKKMLILLALLVTGGVALAEPPTFVEVALVDGGENARNGEGSAFGGEIVGSFGFAENWYAGGALGRFEHDTDGSDLENNYLNINGGRTYSVSDSTTLNWEVGLWFGDQDLDDENTDPTALELKAGVSHELSRRFGMFGSLSWVRADLDTDDDSDLRNYVGAVGLAYQFGEMFSLNLKLVDGVNGVNGQDQVLRLGARWTF